jgi:disulfide bond formation protein DsbB
MIIIGIFFVCGAAISFYHFGIEQGFFSESLVCDIGINNKSTSPQDLLKELNLKAVSCKDVTFRFLGLSLATLNTILSLIICVIMLRLGIKYDKNK